MTYIPRSSLKKSGTSSPIPKVVKKKRTFRVFGFIGTTLLLLSVLGTGGVFFYKSYSEDIKNDARKSLYTAEQKKGDSEAKIQEIKTYDAQLSIAEKLLNEHLAPSKLFDALEMHTKETVQFKTFTYEYDPGFEAFLTLAGGTGEFTSVVLQNTELNPVSLDSPYDVMVVEDVTRNQSTDNEEDRELLVENEVQFNVTGILRTEQLEYSGAPPTPVPQNDDFNDDQDSVESNEDEEFVDEFSADNETDI